ncbi:Histidine kinase domain-containing protein [Sulfidibacter corallicola]|uniref:Histidine kinase domain-containing protein n=1 Tax=Sulfidibacter corallicola TaxID=2818388 RepID=A0A8A4TWD3_SULCO|nr:two-component regulator propeller domain-containing protein [Sulfidibacter corallicola]QTD50835.1 hypothetical protein J3U87_00070 [Sulfidibacter corallicola]
MNVLLSSQRYRLHEARPGLGYLIRVSALLALAIGSMVGPCLAGPILHKFFHIQTEEGLSHGVVYAALQDKNGFLWIATQSGLNRYDGYSLKTFEHDPRDPLSYPASNAGVMILSPDGTFWLGTWGSGVIHFNPATGQFRGSIYDPETQERKLAESRIQSLYLDAKGNLWIGTFDEGLYRYKVSTGDLRAYRHDHDDPQSLSNDRVWSTCEDRSGRIWVATSGGLHRLLPEGNGFQRFRHDPDDPTSISNDVIKRILVDETGYLWLATRGGVNRFDPETLRAESFLFDSAGDPTAPINDIRNLLLDGKGHLWVGSYRSGLVKFELATGKQIGISHNPMDSFSISSDRIEAMYLDTSDVLWVCTNGGGINYTSLHGKHFLHYRHEYANPNSLGSNQVSAVLQDHHGMLWLGTLTTGLTRLDRTSDRYTHYLHDPNNAQSICDDNIRALAEDHLGALWVGSYNRAISVLSPDRTTWRHFPSVRRGGTLSDERIRSLYRDRDNVMWVGGDAGLDRYHREGNRFENILPDRTPEIDRSLRIFSIRQHADRTYWLGTDHGLINLDGEGGHFKWYRNDPNDPTTLSNNRVNVIHLGPHDDLWIGTNQGLNWFRPETGSFRRLFDPNGNQYNVIFGILPDLAGNLWLSTARGLSKYIVKEDRFRHYDVHDGVQSGSFVHNSFFQGAKGEMFFGGRNGLIEFRPEEIRDRTRPPDIVLTSFKVFNEEVSLPRPLHMMEELTLQPDQSMFSLEFAALDFSSPGKNRFRYMLKGFDQHWIDAQSRNSATYTNLDPGTYSFVVVGGNTDNVWNEKGANIRIRIIPPFWTVQRVALLAFLAITMLAVWRYRETEKNRRLLEHRVAERTRSLAEANENLAKTAEELQVAQRELIKAAHQAGMAEIATDTLHNLGNALNTINTSSGQIKDELEGLRPNILRRVVDLIDAHTNDLTDFVHHDKTGRVVPKALEQFYRNLIQVRKTIGSEIHQLDNQVELIKAIVQAQEKYAGADEFMEMVTLNSMVEDALKIQNALLEEFHITVQRDFACDRPVGASKTKLLHVMRHIIKNSVEAMAEMVGEKILRIRLFRESDAFIGLAFEDNGPGIPEEHRTAIFQSGFSTKREARGFGLHFAANAMREMKGRIRLEAGPEHGGCCVLLLFPDPGELAKHDEITLVNIRVPSPEPAARVGEEPSKANPRPA